MNVWQESSGNVLLRATDVITQCATRFPARMQGLPPPADAGAKYAAQPTPVPRQGHGVCMWAGLGRAAAGTRVEAHAL